MKIKFGIYDAWMKIGRKWGLENLGKIQNVEDLTSEHLRFE